MKEHTKKILKKYSKKHTLSQTNHLMKLMWPKDKFNFFLHIRVLLSKKKLYIELQKKKQKPRNLKCQSMKISIQHGIRIGHRIIRFSTNLQMHQTLMHLIQAMIILLVRWLCWFQKFKEIKITLKTSPKLALCILWTKQSTPLTTLLFQLSSRKKADK